MLELLIQIGPTILFLLNLVLAIVFGLLRGFHKNLILAIQALIALAVCTITFFILINDANTDTNIYQMINGIMGGSLNSTIGVSEGCSSLKEVLTEMIVNMSSEGGIGNTIQLIVSNNGEYLGALVNSAYRLVLAIILSITYLLLVFILYLVYFIFYPERRRQERKSEKYSLAESGKPYKKRRLLGAAIGSVRGIISSVVLLSFFGTILYIVSGSNTKSEDVDFGDDSINEYYGIYQSISSYNEYGIYSILSSIKDPNQIPYYLYISDAVFSGNATDIKENGDSSTASFVLKDELGSYTKFSKKAIYLVNKYNPELLKKAVAGAETEELMTELASTFASAGFQDEFSELINGFNDNSFILNFALVALDAVASNYDSFISIEDKTTTDLLDIVFKGEHKIKVSQILTKDDAISLLNATVKILSNPVIFDSTLTASFDAEAAGKLVSSTEVLSDALASLSFLNDRSEGFNLLFADIFDYLTEEATILDTPTTASSYICKMTNTTVNEVNWASELKNVISVLPSVITLYSDLDLSNTEDTTALVESAFNLLATTNTNYDRNETALDNIINVFGNSKVISVLMNLDPVYNALFGSLGEDVTIVIPEVNYENTVDQNGNVVDGEITNLLKGIKALLSSGGEAVIELLNFTSEESDLQLGTIMETALTALLSKDNNNLSLIDYLSKSTIVRSILSSYIDTLEFPIGESNLSIYLPESSYKVVEDKDGNTVRLINEAELPNIISNILPVVTAYKDILNKYNEEDGFDLSAILAPEKIDTLCDLLKKSQILEGTIANILINSLGSNEYVTLPKQYSTPEGWLSSVSDGELVEGELIKTVRILQNVDIDINKLISGDINYILSDGLTDDNIDALLSSDILTISISGILRGISYSDEDGNELLSVIVPNSSLIETTYTDNNDEAISCISINEIKKIFSIVTDLVAFDEDNNVKISYSSIFNKNSDGSYKVLESDVLCATVIYALKNNIDKITYADDSAYAGQAIITMPLALSEAALKDTLINNTGYDGLFSNNPWKNTNELGKLLDAIDILLNISTNPNFDFTSDLTDTLLDSILSLNDVIEEGKDETRLDAVYNSIVIKDTLTSALPKLSEQVIVPADAKDTDGYINVLELKALFDIVNAILGDNKSFDNIDFNNLVIKASMKNSFISSNIISASITNYIINDEQLDKLISIPNSTVMNNHITKEEMGRLYDSLLALIGDSDGNISLSSLSSLDANKMLHLPSDKIDTILASDILQFSISKIIESTDYGDLEIIIPSEAYGEIAAESIDIHGKAIKAISKDTLNSLVSAIGLIINDGTEISVNVKNIFVYKNDLIANPILHATVINYLVKLFSAEDSAVSIPQSLKDNGNPEVLKQGVTANLWNTTNELINLLNSFDLLLGISDSTDDSFDFNNTEEITSSLYTSILGLNEAYDSTKTKLEYVYSSQIIKATLTKNITNVSQIAVPLDALENDYIKASELANVISFANTILGVGQSFEDFDASEIKINNATKDFIINSNILLATITKYLKESSSDLLIIPQAVIDPTYEHLTKLEAEKLFDNVMMLFGTNISLTAISFDFNKLATLSDEQVALLVSSLCLRYTVSNYLLNNESISVVIPSNLIENDIDIQNKDVKAIKEAELSSALSAILDFITLDNPATTDVNETGINIQKVFLNKNAIIASDILHATIVKYLVDEFTKNDSVVIIPTHLALSGTKEELEKGMITNEWSTTSELLNLLNALDLLLKISTTPDFNLNSINIDNALKDMNTISSDGTSTKLELCYKSEIMKATFTSAISKYVADIPGASYDANDYIKVSELETLFDILNIVAGDSGITGLTDENIKNINVSAVIAVISTNESSFIVRSLLSSSILGVLNGIYNGIESWLDCYEASANISLSGNKNTTLNILSLAEILALESGLKAILNVDTDIIASSINTENVILDEAKIESAYQSRIIQAIISKALKSTLGEANIVKECYNNTSLNGQVFASTAAAYNLYLSIAEVKALIHGICTVTGVTSISANSISLSGVEVSNTTIATLLESKIAHVLISNQIKTTLEVPSIVYDANIKLSDNLDVITNTELKALINSILLVLGNDKININSFSFTSGAISSLNIDDILASKIAHNQITKAMLACCTIPSAAYEDLEKQFINTSEIAALVKILGAKKNNGETDYYELSLSGAYSFGSFDGTKIGAMSDSYIIRYNVSKQLLAQSSTIYIPTSAVEVINEDEYIIEAEFKAFLSALTVYGNSLTSISIGLPDSDGLELFANSIIMRATITNSITIDGYSIYFAQADVTLDKAYGSANNIVVLTNQAFKDLINAARVFVTGDELEISLSMASIRGLDNTKLNTLLSSNTLRYAVSDLFVNYINGLDTIFRNALLLAMSNQGITIGNEAVYNSQGVLSQKDAYSKNNIIGIIIILNA